MADGGLAMVAASWGRFHVFAWSFAPSLRLGGLNVVAVELASEGLPSGISIRWHRPPKRRRSEGPDGFARRLRFLDCRRFDFDASAARDRLRAASVAKSVLAALDGENLVATILLHPPDNRFNSYHLPSCRRRFSWLANR